MAERRIPTNEKHIALKNAVLNAAGPYINELPANEVLAIFSQLVGMLIAMQDQTKYSNDAVFRLIEANIEIGNQSVLATMFDNTKGNT